MRYLTDNILIAVYKSNTFVLNRKYCFQRTGDKVQMIIAL